ncbi:MAG TPA: ABC transporter ATP-binding protein [Alphaproteobacteria bacterium]|nr:ABC transporter ATP-binding protein [Alphaproteobacteria bacterium]
MPLLAVENLTVELQTARGPARAVRDVSFALERGESLGIVGESGCGKSLTALALMRLLPENAWTSGSVRLDGTELTTLDEAAMCRVRGRRMAMIFQEPMTSLNPVHRIGAQIAEALRLHRGLKPREGRQEALRLLERVGLSNARRRLDAYPHQLSGGQRQRVMIAMALSCGPDLLIADEPTTALDVTIQGQILDLIGELAAETGMALILISHDLGVIAETCDRVMVMYGGSMAERGPAESVFRRLGHPYSQGLFAAMPRLGRSRAERLATIPGMVPELADLPEGCTFAGRCPLVIDACRAAPPPLLPVEPGHEAACIRLDVALDQAPAGRR